MSLARGSDGSVWVGIVQKDWGKGLQDSKIVLSDRSSRGLSMEASPASSPCTSTAKAIFGSGPITTASSVSMETLSTTMHGRRACPAISSAHSLKTGRHYLGCH